MIERGKKMGKTNDGIGDGYGKLQGADAPAQLAFVVEPDAGEAGSRALTRYESHAEDIGLSVIDVHVEGNISPTASEMMVEGTVAQLGTLLDAFSADEASDEGDVFLYFDHTPNDGVPGVFDNAKPIEYENAALDAIRERHDFENGGILMSILTE